jgi:transcription antitermination factor NusG
MSNRHSPKSSAETRNWYAFYVKPRHEKKASERLREKYEFEVFCPLKEERVRWSDRWKTVAKPYIPGYLFAYVTEKERRAVLDDHSVFRTVCWKGQLAAIREREIEAMKRVLGEADCEDVRLEQLSPGDRVEVIGGELRDMNGVIVTIKGNRAFLHLDSLNCAMIFTMPAALLEPV